MDVYLRLLPWVGRLVSLIVLFAPYGLYLAVMGLVLTETLVLIYRLTRSMEEVLGGEE